jgi:3-phenylpropionate/cinnamic acid dioxygenase small subunit
MTSASIMSTIDVRAVRELLDQYGSCLDRGEFEQWLAMFTADGYYAVLREEELKQDNNVVLIGEDMKRLVARIQSGAERDKRRMVHMWSGVRVDGAAKASASFAMWYDGIPAYAGRVLLELASDESGLRIRHCTIVLHNDLVHVPIYMPI